MFDNIFKQKYCFESNFHLYVIQYGMTGLMEASINGHTDTVRALLEAKPDPNNSDEVKLHFSHCLYNSHLMHYVTGWPDCSPSCCCDG